jgi:hypothetical protein
VEGEAYLIVTGLASAESIPEADEQDCLIAYHLFFKGKSRKRRKTN